MKLTGTAIAFLFFFRIAFSQDEFTKVKTGETAPNFEFTKPDGTVKKLSDLRGKVVLINFFATWCPPCRQELPNLQADIYLKYKDRKDFELLIPGREQKQSTIDSFKVANNYGMLFYPDEKRKIFSLYGTQNIPRNFLIDKEGKITYASVGYNDKEFEYLKQILSTLLK